MLGLYRIINRISIVMFASTVKETKQSKDVGLLEEGDR
jgi:hypothetical protein